MPQNHDNNSFIDHRTGWSPGTEGKGFLIKPTPNGIRNWPVLQGAQPLVWTWPTEDMYPTHPQMKTQTFTAVPQGMSPDPTSYFHIKPDGGVYQVGSGRKLNDEDYGTLKNADPNLDPVTKQPKVQTDGYGHANRLMEILGVKKLGRWFEVPSRWRRVAGGDWFCPAYGIPDHVKEEIQHYAGNLPWDSSAKLQDPSKYHITSFYSPSGYSDPGLHQWVDERAGDSFPAYTHSLDNFTPSGGQSGLQPVVMRFHSPELSQHAEGLMNEAEGKGLQIARFEGGHKPHITLGHNPVPVQAETPHIGFKTTPLHELHSYYDSLK